MYSVALGFGVGTIHTPASCKRKSPTNIRVAPSLIKSVMISYQAKWYLEEKLKKNLSLVKKSKYEMRFLTVFIQWFLYQCNQKYVWVQSWKAAHLPTLEIRVEQKRNWVKQDWKSFQSTSASLEVLMLKISVYNFNKFRSSICF